ncbi:TetR/AcrR family transcriptional regulator [Rubellimicrobium sp. CFH 75288]|uniref:TetR/AcrR family transcriptional regulator n=1 Tax=Rubellimicrobium sp. CFH 75288 TaxID=2697034 RepID=UPI00210F7C8F|nr:TetR/AcrR family transcriptional regulator [Rubellimicrobium sp. CFH 75288]
MSAAVARFRRDGFHAARMEDLAGDAEVSVGTLYNYYGTKGDLLMATVAMEVEEVLARGEAVIADPPDSAEEALLRLTWTYYDHSLEWLSKEMWRAAIALSVQEPHTPNGRRYAELDARLAGQVGRLLARLQERGRLHPALPPAVVGQVLFNNLNAMFIDFVRDDAMDLDTLKARVARQTRPLARMMETVR